MTLRLGYALRKQFSTRRTLHPLKINPLHLGGCNYLPTFRADRIEGRQHFCEIDFLAADHFDILSVAMVHRRKRRFDAHGRAFSKRPCGLKPLVRRVASQSAVFLFVFFFCFLVTLFQLWF